MKLKAPFPWFGGKAKVAHLVWQRFGNVGNLVDPFFGSGAVLLQRPHPPKVETANDLDCYVANFYRALQHDPDGVAHYADWPVNEADLHARHWWLVQQEDFREHMKTDPDFYDTKVAGWWVWGICQWIGSGWCDLGKYERNKDTRPALGNAGMGVHKKRPHLMTVEKGINAARVARPSQKLPHLGDAGRLVQRPSQQRPQLSRPGRGIPGGLDHGRFGKPSEQLPAIRGDSGAAGNGIHSTAFERKTGGLYAYMHALADRLRRVRVCCGDWSRVLGPSVTEKIGVTGIFLDPPYTSADRADVYSQETRTVAQEVAAWAIEHGDNPMLRIALCGYEGDYEMPDTWECIPWKTPGGYSSQNRNGNDNPYKERIWFSPHCLNLRPGLFDLMTTDIEGSEQDTDALPLFQEVGE